MSLFEGGGVDPAGEDAEGGELLECLVFGEVAFGVAEGVADGGVATFGEVTDAAVDAGERFRSVIGHDAEPRFSWLGRVQAEGLVEQIGFGDVEPVELVLRLGVDLDAGSADGFAVVTALPERPGAVPGPRVQVPRVEQ